MTDLNPLQTLVLEFLDRADSGEDAHTLLKEMCAAHPPQADALRRRLTVLRSMGILTGDATVEIPERLGEFRLLSRLGGGGMGVVYLAEQEGLGRQVALKIIRPAQLFFGSARERFQREVEAVASLQHPGIVPIYSVGESDGVPYFAMERVFGCTLAKLLDEVKDFDPAQLTGADMSAAIAKHAQDAEAPVTPAYLFSGSWEEASLHLVRQVADAMHHAHRRGVLHRDIKPSNVMVTPDGRAMLLDFGLASADSGSEQDADLTRTGTLLGSMPYMSPEQTRGESHLLDVRSDVYSLGVTLYELLALRPAFGGGSSPETIAAIQQGQRKPPQQLNPTVSWEAETVCLTAMDHDPARRYASALDLHRDLGNVLEHRPIEARRASVLLQLRRWAQRHPTASVAMVLGGILLIGGPSVFAWQQHEARLVEETKNERIEADSKTISEQSTEILAQSEQVQRQFDLALLTVDSMLTRVGAIRLSHSPQMTVVRRQLLLEALEFYRLLLADQANNPSVLMSMARALLIEGEVLGLLGDIRLAENSQRQALEILEDLATADPGNRGYALELAFGLRKLGAQILAAGRLTEALDLTARAADAQQLLLAEIDDPDGEQRRQLVLTFVNLGSMQDSAEQLSDSAQSFERALAVARSLVEEFPNNSGHLAILARALTGMGKAAETGMRKTEAAQFFTEALSLYERCRQAFPGSPEFLAELADTWSHLAFSQDANYDAAAASFLKGYRLQEELTRNFPDVAIYQQLLAVTCLQMAELNNQHKQGPIEDRFREALIRQTILLEHNPDLAGLRSELANTSISFASWLLEEGQAEEALKLADDARDHYLSLRAGGLLNTIMTDLLDECERIRGVVAAALQVGATGS
jgi:serine/threonine protein kinase